MDRPLVSCSRVDLLKFFLRSLHERSRASYKRNSPGVYTLMKCMRLGLLSRNFLVCLIYSFSFFFISTCFMEFSFNIFNTFKLSITLRKCCSHQGYVMFFHSSLSDSESPLVFWTILCYLTDLTNTLVRIVSILPQISNSFSHLKNRFTYTNYNWYHRHPLIPQVFSSLARSKNLTAFIFTIFPTVLDRYGTIYFFLS